MAAPSVKHSVGGTKQDLAQGQICILDSLLNPNCLRAGGATNKLTLQGHDDDRFT